MEWEHLASLAANEFIVLGIQVHKECDIELQEITCSQEPHADGSPHLNLLVRASSQYA
jgi:hypothetical protein